MTPEQVLHLTQCAFSAIAETSVILEHSDDLTEWYINISGGYITISPTKVEVPSIGGSRLVDGYLLEKSVYIPGSLDQPDDVDVVEVGRYTNPGRAAVEAVKTYVESLAEKAVESAWLDFEK